MTSKDGFWNTSHSWELVTKEEWQVGNGLVSYDALWVADRRYHSIVALAQVCEVDRCKPPTVSSKPISSRST